MFNHCTLWARNFGHSLTPTPANLIMMGRMRLCCMLLRQSALLINMGKDLPVNSQSQTTSASMTGTLMGAPSSSLNPWTNTDWSFLLTMEALTPTTGESAWLSHLFLVLQCSVPQMPLCGQGNERNNPRQHCEPHQSLEQWKFSPQGMNQVTPCIDWRSWVCLFVGRLFGGLFITCFFRLLLFQSCNLLI